GLGVIPDIHAAESEQRGFVCLFFGSGVGILLLAALADHWRKNGDALFAALNAPTKLVPCEHPRNSCGVGLLSRYQEDIPKTVRMEMRHRIKKRGQAFTVFGFQLLDEIFHVFADELLCAGWLPVITAGSRIDGG